jgi:hypothetical protein
MVVLNYHIAQFLLVLFNFQSELTSKKKANIKTWWSQLMEISTKLLHFLKGFFAFTLLTMLSITITASINQNIFEAVGNMWPNWWFRATLADAYFGFLVFFVWVAYKELRIWRKLLWFALIMLLGNLAIPAYMLTEIYKLQVGDSFATLLTRRNG